MRKRLPCSFSGNPQRYKIAQKICRELRINMNDYLNDAVDSLINNYGKEYKIAMLVRERETINQELEALDKFKINVERIREITNGYELVKDTASRYFKGIRKGKAVRGEHIWHSINGAARTHMITFEQAKQVYLEVLPGVIEDADEVQYIYNEIMGLTGGMRVAIQTPT